MKKDLLVPILSARTSDGKYMLMKDGNFTRMLNLYWHSLNLGQACITIPFHGQCDDLGELFQAFPNIEFVRMYYGNSIAETRLGFWHVNRKFDWGKYNDFVIGIEGAESVLDSFVYVLNTSPIPNLRQPCDDYVDAILATAYKAKITYIQDYAQRHMLAGAGKIQLKKTFLHQKYVDSIMQNLPIEQKIHAEYLCPIRLSNRDYNVKLLIEQFGNEYVICTNANNVADLPEHWSSVKLNKAEYYYALQHCKKILFYKASPISHSTEADFRYFNCG